MQEIDFSQHLLLSLAMAYLSGVATSLTPCVYPLIPIVVSYLGNQSGSTKNRFTAALAYVLGLSLVYTLLGLVAVFTGSFFGDLTTNMYVYLAFAILILILGGSMMDWYQIPTPSWLQPKADAAGTQPAGIWKPFIIGASSGLVAAPCTAPVLASILIYIASQQQYFNGSLLMLSFSFGMNTLLLVIGFSAGIVRNLPKSGVWMLRIKKGLALILIASGLYFVFRAGQIS